MSTNYPSSLPSYLEQYRLLHPEDVFIVEDEIDLNFETTAYYKLLEKRSPIIWFKNIKGYKDFTLVSNVLGKRDRQSFAIGCSIEQMPERWNKIISHSSKVKVLTDDLKGAPIKQKVFLGNELDLFSLPAPRHYLSDGSYKGFGRYITSGLAVARNPSSREMINLSFTRIQIIDKNRYAFDMGSRGHFWHYVQTARETGMKRLPVSILVGAHPLYYMLAASFVENEYSKAAFLLGDSTYIPGVENDIPVPSNAEVVLEAEVALDETFQEGPFSEFTGYMAKRSTGGVAYVKSILRKNNPIFYDIPGANSREHVALFSMPKDIAVSRAIKEFMPPANYKVEWPPSASRFMALCCVPRPEPGLSKQVGLALLALDPLFSKVVIVNDGECELSLERLLFNLSQSNPERGVNIDIISNVFIIKLDPSADANGTNGKMLIVTKGSELGYNRVFRDGARLLLLGEKIMVAFSHKFIPEAIINVLLGDDINLQNIDDIVWALATRLRPSEDVMIADEHVTFRAVEPRSEIPKIPAEVISSVEARLRSSGSISDD